MFGTLNVFMKIILLQSAFGLPFDTTEVKGDDDNADTEVFDEPSDYYYNTEVERADSSISFAGNAEEALLKVLSEKRLHVVLSTDFIIRIMTFS